MLDRDHGKPNQTPADIDQIEKEEEKERDSDDASAFSSLLLYYTCKDLFLLRHRNVIHS